MKKKLLIALFAITAAVCGAFGFSACGDKTNNSGNGGNTEQDGNQGGNTQKPEHTTHTYDQKNTAAKYLKSEATCQHKAEYYFSCTCGKKGTETFEYGELADHDFKNYVSDDNATCVKNATETAKCEYCAEKDTREIANTATGKHEFINYVSNSDATCTKNCTETAKCEFCDKTNTREIEYSKHTLVDGICEVCGKGYENGFTYILASDSQSYILVDAVDAVKNNSKIIIPDIFKNLPVTRIGNWAFENYSSLVSITIPDSVTSIGDNGFSYYSSLTEIKFKDIASYCQIDGLRYVDKNKVYIGGQKLTEMTSIVIPDSVTRIYSNAFEGCGSLTEIKFKDMASYCQIDGLYNVDKSKVYIGGQKLMEMTSVVISESVTSIGERAFYECSSLSSLTIPDSVTSIGQYAFYGCPIETATIPAIACRYINNSKLKTVTITSGESIGVYAFEDCSALTSITIPNSVTSIGWHAFYNCPIETATIPATACGYIKNSKLKSVTITSGESIGSSAFYNCSSLTSITIPDSVTSIGNSVFGDCHSLTSITIPDSVTSIGDLAFDGCSSLTSITIPDSVTKVGGGVFYGCTSLTTVKLSANMTSLPFYDNSIPPYGFFGNCSSLTSLTIPDGVTSIYAYTFDGCNKLIQKKNGVSYVDKWVIDYDTSVSQVTLRNDTKGIADRAFYECSSLRNITIPEGVTSIGDGAFDNCSSLTSVTIPDGVTSIGDHTFSDCSSLKSVTIPDSVTVIYRYAFSDCSSLKSVTIPDSVTTIGQGAFYGCSLLTSVTIGNGVKSIGESAFSSCSSLTSVTIPDGVTSIGDHTFSGCSSLSSITIPDGVTSIGNHAFYNCSSLSSITFKGTKVEWNAIEKGYNWNYKTGNYTIHYTDGTISK